MNVDTRPAAVCSVVSVKATCLCSSVLSESDNLLKVISAARVYEGSGPWTGKPWMSERPWKRLVSDARRRGATCRLISRLPPAPQRAPRFVF